jgi:hypothetical protein
MKCRANSNLADKCCFKGGVKLGVDVDPNRCCSGDADIAGKCFPEA